MNEISSKKGELIERSKYLLDDVCANCQEVIENRKNMGNKKAYSHCIHYCSVGKELQSIGKQLLKMREEEKYIK